MTSIVELPLLELVAELLVQRRAIAVASKQPLPLIDVFVSL